MADEGERRLAAILSADVAGYSKLMGDDERATVLTLTDYREVFADQIARHKGHVVDSPGDNLLAEFASPVEAVDAAIDIQRELGRRNRQLAEHRQMQFRIGLNLGDVIAKKDGTIYGDGVNIAARLEGLAAAGGICLSETIFLQTEGKVEAAFEDIGTHEVKNIAKPVRTYRIVPDETARVAQSPTYILGAAAAAALVIVIVAGVLFWPDGDPEDPILAMPTGPTIAVLPFTNMSGDPEQEYFSDGISEDIITELSRFDELHVISRLSTFQYKDKAVDVRQVGRELGAHYVVEGSVRKAENRMRVTAQLLDAKDGKHLWAESYDRDLTAADIFAVQDEVTSHIVTTIADAYGIIRVTQMAEVKRTATTDLGAYECVLRAHEYYRAVFTPAMHLEVRNCLEQAVETDSNYADAWTWLAGMYRDEYSFKFNPQANPLERAEKAANRAIALEPSNQAAHAFLADVLFHRHDADSFYEQAEHAVAVNPNSANVLAWMGSKMWSAGYWERGVLFTRKGIALSRDPPGWMYFALTGDHYRKGEYEEALEYALKMRLPGWFWTHILQAAAYGRLGRTTEGLTAVTKLLETYPAFDTDGRKYLLRWFWDKNLAEDFMGGLHKAGLDTPDESTAAD